MKGNLIILFFSLIVVNQAKGQIVKDSISDEENFFYIDDDLMDSTGVLSIWDIRFHIGRNTLIDTNDYRILAIAAYMQKHPTYVFELGYHRDCRGSKYSSRDLSQSRAKAICDRLIELGISSDRLIPKGFGETTPVSVDGIVYNCEYIMKFSPPEQEAMHAKNRRVELRIISKDFVETN